MHVWCISYPDTRDYDALTYDAFTYDACFYDACIPDVMHVSMILDTDTCMYDAYIYVPRPLTLMHVCMMGGYPGRDGAVVGLEQAYYEVGIIM